MAADVELRDRWARSIYSNFSSHDCIRHEVEILARATEVGDDLLSRIPKDQYSTSEKTCREESERTPSTMRLQSFLPPIKAYLIRQTRSS